MVRAGGVRTRGVSKRGRAEDKYKEVDGDLKGKKKERITICYGGPVECWGSG